MSAWARRLRSLLGAGLPLALGLLVGVPPVHAADDFLEPDKAFHFGVRALDDRSIEVSFEVAPGYYLYREAFRFSAEGASLGAPELPAGHVKFDETFQKNVETYRDTVRVRLPVLAAPAGFRLTVASQGCADRGLCYPPMPSAADIRLRGFGGDGSVKIVAAGDAMPEAAEAARSAPRVDAGSEMGTIGAALRTGSFWSVIGAFFVAGLLLSLTPCVLPMLPILSSIIVGQGQAVSRWRGLALAGCYALGMALVYTALGVAAGLAGEGLSAALQNRWVVGAFALLLVMLALSMFGVYTLQLPAGLGTRLSEASQRLPAGRVAGVFAMGGLSALIVSPCVAAPLAGALLYLSQTRDVQLGGTALFSLAAGMSVPLLVVGASAGALLPRTGAWMDDVKRFFGVLLLGVALWTAQALLPAALVLSLWGALLIAAALLLRPWLAGQAPWSVLRRTAAVALATLGVLQLAGAASGAVDPLRPLARFGAASLAAAEPLPFHRVRNVAELDAAIAAAGKPVLLDFYADWCVSCKEMDRFTLRDAAVRERLSRAVLLQADVTANSADDRALLRRFQLFGPPGTLFFDPQGREIGAARVVGFQRRDTFLETLSTAGL